MHFTRGSGGREKQSLGMRHEKYIKIPASLRAFLLNLVSSLKIFLSKRMELSLVMPGRVGGGACTLQYIVAAERGGKREKAPARKRPQGID